MIWRSAIFHGDALCDFFLVLKVTAFLAGAHILRSPGSSLIGDSGQKAKKDYVKVMDAKNSE